MNFAFKYEKELGFQFIIDGVYKHPADKFAVVTFSENPPGKYYQTSKNTSDLRLFTDVQFMKSYETLTLLNNQKELMKLDYNSQAHIVVEVYMVNVKKNDNSPTFERYGWTIVPLFNHEQFLIQGLYQIPIFEGEVQTSLLDLILNEKNVSVWDHVE